VLRSTLVNLWLKCNMLTISRMFYSKHIVFQLVIVKYYHYINNCRFCRTYRFTKTCMTARRRTKWTLATDYRNAVATVPSRRNSIRKYYSSVRINKYGRQLSAGCDIGLPSTGLWRCAVGCKCCNL